MIKFNNRIMAFTLVEVLVSITIFSMMSISILYIYFSSNDITLKSDINRMMQENLKNVSNKIAEDIRKDGVLGVSASPIDDCNMNIISGLYKWGDKLCTNSSNIYYLAKENPISGDYIRVDSSECEGIENHCLIAGGLDKPLTNSYVSVKDLDFYLSNDKIPKLTINIEVQPSIQKGVKTDLIKESKIIFQTTISERPF